MRQQIRLTSDRDYDVFMAAALPALGLGVAPHDISWITEEQDGLSLFGEPELDLSGAPPANLKISDRFEDMARRVLCHKDPDRFHHLYAYLHQLHSIPAQVKDPLNPHVDWLKKAEKNIRRDVHKMHAFVRFVKIGERGGREQFTCWFEPDHNIVEYTAGFFIRRFGAIDWEILTPRGCIKWDGQHLRTAPGLATKPVLKTDDTVSAWKTYYKNIFNPARLKLQAMQSEMPKKYWKNLPEAELISDLIIDAERKECRYLGAAPSAPNRLAGKVSVPRVFDALPSDVQSLEDARAKAAACRDCPLGDCASQTVFGEGPPDARIMVVGEQPGDAEDIAGRPFVGPAGQLLDEIFTETGIRRNEVYLTNAVKHFKYQVRGKRRIHQKPSPEDIRACQMWLDLERYFVQPDIIVTLGASAARAVLGKTVTMKEVRGQPQPLPGGTLCLPTYHPAYILRLPDRERAQQARNLMVDDVRVALSHLSRAAA